MCEGVFSLLTESGHLLVNDVKASCYAGLELSGLVGDKIAPKLRSLLTSHKFHHVFFSPARWAGQLVNLPNERHIHSPFPVAWRAAAWFGIHLVPGQCPTLSYKQSVGFVGLGKIKLVAPKSIDAWNRTSSLVA